MRLALLAALLLAPAASAQEVKRHVLALVPGTKPDPHHENQVHALLECPINHLGVVVRHHYMGTGHPPDGCLDDARAVLTCFDSDTPEPVWLWDFLEKDVAGRDLRVVHFGDWGPLARDPERLAAWLRRFGLQGQELFQRGPFGVTVEMRSRELCSFEADPRLRTIHTGPRSVDGKNTPWIETTSTDGTTCHPVVTGPWGGLALDPWTLRRGSDHQDRRWHLDPFAFFRDALGLARVPAPHPAVLNGRRMWFLQVDGDGFESLSSIGAGTYAAKVMKEEIFERYPLPYTVSVVIRSLTLDYDVAESTPAMELARKILALPNVEPASHGVLHTLEWRESDVPEEDKAHDRPMWYPSLENYDYSPVNEVRDSIRFINERLTERPRRCVVMLWTGEANPREDAIQAATDMGCVNLNGGVFRWDRWHDSVGFVSPWSRRVGKALQVYAGAPNENDYDGFFETMPGAFRHVEQTIERTGSPRILKPADVYIHFYSAEKRARLDTIHALVKRWATEEPTAPVFASTYVHAVIGAVETARIVRTPEGWSFRDFGGCRSVRIEDEPRVVDLARSTGVLGTRRLGNRLWIHLSAPDADVVLAEAAPRRPYVEEANCLLGDAVLGERGVAVTARAHNPRMVVFGGFSANAEVTLQVGGKPRRTKADASGRVTVRLPEPGSTRVIVGQLR